MLINVLLVLIYLKFCQAQNDTTSNILIDYINNKNTTWKANKHSKIEKHAPEFVGEDPKFHKKLPAKIAIRGLSSSTLPSSFDARLKWPFCSSIGEIKDQGACGSCWAVAASSIMTDRFCIKSNGTINRRLSAEHLLSCCTTCGSGCQGGSSAAALNYFVTDGIVTGGDYDSNEGCKPYSFEGCQHYGAGNKEPCSLFDPATPTCVKECSSFYPIFYEDDLFYGNKAYTVCNSTHEIMIEIMEFGSVLAVFDVYNDFVFYTTGIYQYLKGKFLGRHAIKIIGWGAEGGIPYWLVVNSWNQDWGDKGLFKIIKGSNHCKIEEFVMAGQPLIK